MNGLRDFEIAEFEKTFNFIDAYIGCARHMKAASIHELRFDGAKCQPKLISFITKNFQDNLVKVNEAFNIKTTEHKQQMIQKLIKYCFNNNVQPHELRIRNFSKYWIEKIEEPTIYEYGAA